MNRNTYIDLFSGAGGFTLGFDKVGFDNIFSIDINPSFCSTYRHNFPNHELIESDISTISEVMIEKISKGVPIDVVIGGPPCQGFSIAGNIGRRFLDDPRNHLYKEFVRIVGIVQPKVIVMENVARLHSHNQGKTRAEIIKDFRRLGYQVECKVLNSADYGVPQLRKRVFFIGSKQGKIVFPERTVEEYVTVGQALESYPKLRSGQSSNLINHESMNHSEQMLKKMKFVPNGGNRMAIPEEIRPTSGDARKYIRYDSDKPSVTVTGDMRKVFHYDQNRALTVRELAALQSFPDSFEFKGTRISQQQQVGNSVPPLMAEQIALTVLQILQDEKIS